MDTTLVSAALFFGSIIMIIIGLVIALRGDGSWIGAVMAAIGMVGLTGWFPFTADDIHTAGTLSAFLGSASEIVLAGAWWIILGISLLIGWAAYEAYNTRVPIDIRHLRVGHYEELPETTIEQAPDGGETPDEQNAREERNRQALARRDAVIHDRHQTRESILIGLIALAGIAYSIFYLFPNRPNASFKRLVTVANQHDEVFSGDHKYQAFYRPFGLIRCKISLTQEDMSQEMRDGLEDAIETEASARSSDNRWYGLDITSIKGATFYSTDGRTWNQADVEFEGMLPVNPQAERDSPETVNATKAVRNAQEFTDTTTHNNALIEKLTIEVMKEVGPEGLTTVIERKEPATKKVTGKNLFAPSHGGDFRESK